MRFETILEEIGSFGLYQKLLCFVFIPTTTGLVGLVYYGQLLILASPPYTCNQGGAGGRGGGEWEDFLHLLNSTPYKDEARQQYACHRYDPNATQLDLENVTSLAQLPQPGLTCDSGWTYDYDELFSTYTSEHNWVCGDAWRPYLIITIFWVGNTVGSWIWGIVSDVYGRRVAIVGSMIVYGTSGMASVFVYNFYAFAVLRFLTGSSHHTVAHLPFVLAVEYCVESKRVIPLLTAMSTYTLASLLSPALAWLLWDWYPIALIPAILTLALPISARWLPESASWLVTRGRGEDARKQLATVARVNGRELPPDVMERLLGGGEERKEEGRKEEGGSNKIDEERETDNGREGKNWATEGWKGEKHDREGKENKEEEESKGRKEESKTREERREKKKNDETNDGKENGITKDDQNENRVGKIRKTEEVKKRQEEGRAEKMEEEDMKMKGEGEREEEKRKSSGQSILQAVKYPGLRRNILLVLLVWMMGCMCFYGHCQNTANLGTNALLSYLLGALVEVPSWCVPFVINRWGRRLPLIVVFLVSAAAGFMYAIVPEDMGWLVLTAGLVGRGFITGAYYICLQYGPEIFPTVVRGQGVALAETLGGIAIFLSPLIVFLGEYERTAPLLVFAGLSVLGGGATVLLPETGGAALPHTLPQAEVFAKKEAPRCWRSKSSDCDPEVAQEVRMEAKV